MERIAWNGIIRIERMDSICIVMVVIVLLYNYR